MYSRRAIICCGVVCGAILGADSPSFSQKASIAQAAPDRFTCVPLNREVIATPADATAIDRFSDDLRKQFVEAKNIGRLKGRAVLAEALEIIDQIESDSDAARRKLAELKETLMFYRRLLDASDADFKTLQHRLEQAPNVFENFLLFEIKFQLEDDARYEKETLAQAFERLDNVVPVLKLTKAKTDDDRIRDECAILIERIEKYHKPRIQKAQSRLALIGSRAVWPTGDRSMWVNGEPLGAEEYRGKVVLIDFWDLSCEPCITGFAKVEDWRKKYSRRGLIVVSVIREGEGVDPNGKTKAERIETLFRTKNLDIPCIVDEGVVFEAHRVDGVPHYVLIDRSGIIRTIRTGNQTQREMEVEIERLLNEVHR